MSLTVVTSLCLCVSQHHGTHLKYTRFYLNKRGSLTLLFHVSIQVGLPVRPLLVSRLRCLHPVFLPWMLLVSGDSLAHQGYHLV